MHKVDHNFLFLLKSGVTVFKVGSSFLALFFIIKIENQSYK